MAVGCLSAAILGYELVLMRLFSIVGWSSFAAMVISIALLGFGASGTALALLRRPLLARFEGAFAAFAALFAATAVAGFAAALRVPFNPLAIVWEPRQLAWLALDYALLVPPLEGAARASEPSRAGGSRDARPGASRRLGDAGAGGGAVGAADPRAPGAAPAALRAWVAPYFLALGLAFLLVEIAFIERFTLFLGHPLHAVAVALAGFLAFAGAGSALAPRLERALGRHAVRAAVLAIPAVALGYLPLLPPLFGAAIGWPVGAKVALALALIAPLAAPMGAPFPLGIARAARGPRARTRTSCPGPGASTAAPRSRRRSWPRCWPRASASPASSSSPSRSTGPRPSSCPGPRARRRRIGGERDGARPPPGAHGGRAPHDDHARPRLTGGRAWSSCDVNRPPRPDPGEDHA